MSHLGSHRGPRGARSRSRLVAAAAGVLASLAVVLAAVPVAVPSAGAAPGTPAATDAPSQAGAKEGAGDGHGVDPSWQGVRLDVRRARVLGRTVAWAAVGSGPTLLLLNGTGSPMAEWDPALLAALTQRGRRVVVFDYPGLGQSQRLRGRLTFDRLADVAAELIDQTVDGPVDVLGWSMGGFVAQRLLVRHPHAVRAVVLAGTNPGGAGTVLGPRWVQRVDSDPDAGIEAYVRTNYPRTARQRGWAFVERVIDRQDVGAYPPSTVPESTYADMVAAEDPWLRSDANAEDLRAVGAPVLVTTGTRDVVTPRSNSRRLADLIPDARILLWPGAGHSFLFQAPDRVGGAVDRFLRQASAGGRTGGFAGRGAAAMVAPGAAVLPGTATRSVGTATPAVVAASDPATDPTDADDPAAVRPAAETASESTPDPTDTATTSADPTGSATGLDPTATGTASSPTATSSVSPTQVPSTTRAPTEATSATTVPTESPSRTESSSPRPSVTESGSESASPAPTVTRTVRPATPPAVTTSGIEWPTVLIAVVALVVAGGIVLVAYRRGKLRLPIVPPVDGSGSDSEPGSGAGTTTEAAPPGEPEAAVATTGTSESPGPTATASEISDVGSAADLSAFLVELGEAMIDAGDPVNDIQETLIDVARSHGSPDAEAVVLPTALIVSVPGAGTVQTSVAVAGTVRLRLDQVADVFEVAADARRGAVDPGHGIHRLDVARHKPAPYGPGARVAGYVVMTLGLALILRASGADLAVSGLLGLMAGTAQVLADRLTTPVKAFLPLLIAFFVALAVFVLPRVGLDVSQLAPLAAPLVTLLPGALLTTSVIELATGQMLAGAARLAAGMLQLLMLSLGVVAASQLVGVPATTVGDAATHPLGPMTPWIGVALYGFGVVVYYGARRASLWWILLVLYVAYAAQVLGGLVLGGVLSAFVGAAAMTPVALFVATRRSGPPVMVSFLPAFWLLVPGSLGLVGLTSLLGANAAAGVNTLMTTATTMISIALGVLLGLALAGGRGGLTGGTLGLRVLRR